MKDRSGEAFTRLNLGIITYERGDLGRAHDHLDACLPIFEALGDRRSAAYTLGHIGNVHHGIGIAQDNGERSREGMAYLRLGLEMFRQLHVRDGEAWTLLDIGVVHSDNGQYEEAAECLDRCLEIYRALGDDQLAARTSVAQGDLLERQGRFGEAVTAFDEAAPVLRAKEDLLWEARLLRGKGLVAAKQGETDAAVAAWTASAGLYRSLQAPAEAEVKRLLAELGNPDHQSQP
jgi:tetratricopeptide (TPR) repeat protein